jgi:hypothetical protein
LFAINKKIKKGKKPIRYLDNVPKLGVDRVKKMQSSVQNITNGNKVCWVNFVCEINQLSTNRNTIKFSIDAMSAINPCASHTNGLNKPENNASGAFEIMLCQVG